MTTLGFSQEAEAAGMDGTVFSRDDLSINGMGSLTVSASEAHGIVGNDDLVIAGGKITVDAALDALHANDGLRITSAEMQLNAGDDGISLTGTESELYLESGNIEITAADSGLSAGNLIHIVGGTLKIHSDDDGISAARDILVEGGEMEISAGDDGIHADNAVAIREGTVRIPACYEGIEAITIDISGGEIAIYPEDDGLNANGATGGFGGRPGGGGPGGFGGLRPFEENNGNMAHERPDFERPDGPAGMPQGNPPFEPDATEALTAEAKTSDVDTWIHVSGGSITVVNDVARDADGLDSNGDIIISGGIIRVSLTNSGSNSSHRIQTKDR